MNLKIEDLMRKISLPKRYFNNDFVIADRFREEKDKFLSFISQCKGEEFDNAKKSQIQKELLIAIQAAEDISSHILNIFECYEKADNKKAQELMDEIMKQLQDDLFVGTIDDRVAINCNGKNYFIGFRMTQGSRFFRVRAVDYESSEIQKNADELFHIPLSKRSYSNNERFSLVGFPSLYLSTMLPLAWQECGYPQKYYYSEYQYEKNVYLKSEEYLSENELKFLMLYSPDEIYIWGTSIKYDNFTLWLNVIIRYLKAYPLVLACSFVNQSGKVPFKQEYIIPQMLMQWVQRNNSVVQGIEYFSCVDMTMRTSEWCAYNIVIPAMPLYDDRKYSKILKEKFCWSVPRFYAIPIFDQKYNDEDRKNVYDFVSDVRSAIRTYFIPNHYGEVLFKMVNICGCLMSLLENQKVMDMQLVLNILNALSDNINAIKEMRLDTNIEEKIKKEKDIDMLNETDISDVCELFKKIYSKFVNQSSSHDSIEHIIKKHIDLCWNDFHPHFEVQAICKSEKEMEESRKWLKENHILYTILKIDSSDEAITCLRKISSETKVSLDDFGGCHVENDEWIKNNFNKIETPIFIKLNDVSIYSEPGIKSVEMVSIGFDKDVLLSKLITEC